MKVLSNKGIIPADQLADWQAWSPCELGKSPVFAGLTAAQAEALTQSLTLAERAPVEPLPEPEDRDETAPPTSPLGYPTAAELETIHQEAWQGGYEAGVTAGHAEGFASGQAAGHEQGLQQVQEEFNGAWAPLQAMAGAFSDALAGLEQELSASLLALALKLAERLAASHLAQDPRAIEPLLAEALASLPTTLAQGRLRVNPLDLAVARQFLQQERPETVWQWIEDSAVARGGCLLDTPSMRQDLTLPARLRAMSTALGLPEVDDGAA